MRNENPTTVAPIDSTSARVAAAVPPVASTSSTMRTRAQRAARVVVNLERVGAVLERVFLPARPAGQLAGFAHRHEASSEPLRDWAAENESSALDRDDVRDRRRRTNGAAIASVAAPNAAASARSGVMSLNTIPGLG